MKVIAVLALIFAASEAAITCDDCKEFSTAMQGYLMSEESVNEQVGLLVAFLCPQAEDVAQCEEGIPAYWPAFAAAMYPVFLEAGSVCGQIGACKKSAYQKVMEPTCDECTEGVAAVANVIGSEGKIVEIVDFLKGDGYCAGAGDENCAAAVDMLIPPAMPALAAVLVERSEQYCCELSTSGVCC